MAGAQRTVPQWEAQGASGERLLVCSEEDRKLPPHSPGDVLVLVALLSLRGSCQNVTSPSFGGVKQIHRPSLPLLFPTVGRV